MIDKIESVRAMLPRNGNGIEDTQIVVYLEFAKDEILSWLYANSTVPESVNEVPTKYNTVQIMSVVVGYGLLGGTNETAHNENGIDRTFRYSDMVDYIRSHVTPYMRLG